MVTRNEDRQVLVMENFKGGEGRVVNRVILPAEGMYGKGRIFNVGRLEKNCEIGWHIHEGDGETFLILSGEGEFNDNGTVTTVRAGDVCFTGDGEGHSLKNLRDEPLEYVALVLYHGWRKFGKTHWRPTSLRFMTSSSSAFIARCSPR